MLLLLVHSMLANSAQQCLPPSGYLLLIQTLFFCIMMHLRSFSHRSKLLARVCFVGCCFCLQCSQTRSIYWGRRNFNNAPSERNSKSSDAYSQKPKETKKNTETYNKSTTKKLSCLLYLHSNLPHLFSKRTANIYITLLTTYSSRSFDSDRPTIRTSEAFVCFIVPSSAKSTMFVRFHPWLMLLLLLCC